MSVIAFPKSNLRDPAVIRQLKKEIDCCERCGVPKEYAVLEAAHIVGRSTGPDMRENIVILCGPASVQQGCHGGNHTGQISKEELFGLAARREGITPDECRKRVRRRMGYDVE